MARVNVYLPDDLAQVARGSDINVSAITQDAGRRALEEDEVDAWIDSLQSLHPTGLGHRDIADALQTAGTEFETSVEA